jgi:serine-type D-Ala-D-Ala carboxypeptidase/endopeptidase
MRSEDDEQIKKALKSFVDPQKYGGIIAGVIDSGGKRVYSYGSGASGSQLQPFTILEIGSVTKVFTAFLLANMVRTGELFIDDPISKYVSQLDHQLKYGQNEATLFHIATHTSSLPRVPMKIILAQILSKIISLIKKDNEFVLGGPYAKYTIKDMYNFLSHYKLKYVPGEFYEYSNIGYALLGHILELRSGFPYEELISERICKRIGMRDMQMLKLPLNRERLALGYSSEGHISRYWKMSAFKGAGGLCSTVDDLFKFLSLNLGLIDSELALDTITCQSKRIKVKRKHPDKKVRDNSELSNWVELALGWHINYVNGAELFWHNGMTGGFSSFVGFIKKKQIATVVLSNSANPVDSIGFQILKILSNE